MPLTDQFYASNTPGLNRVIQDFGLCTLKGEYVYTAKLRAKGLLLIIFFAPNSAPSVQALTTIQGWTAEIGSPKWSAVAVTEGDRDEVAAWAEGRALDGITILLDHELYQTRRWGVSHLPTVYLVDGRTGRVLSKVTGDDGAGLNAAKQTLTDTVAKMVAADEAAKKAEDDKKAADAAKAAEDAAKASQAAASVDKPSEPNPSQAAKA